MITIFCTTCGAKLNVKNDALIGKIAACPKCQCLIHIQVPAEPVSPPQETTSQETTSQETTPQETAGEENRQEELAEELTEELTGEITEELSDTEMKTRKVLLAILVFLVFLLLVLGYFMLFRKTPPPSYRQQNDSPQSNQQQNNHQQSSPPPVRPADSAEKPNSSPDPATDPATDPAVPVAAEPVLSEPVSPKPKPETEPEMEMETVPADSPALPPEKDNTAEPKISVRLTEDSSPEPAKNGLGLSEYSMPEIDIAAKLALPVSEWNVDRLALIEFIRIISRMTDVPITLDTDAVKLAGLSADSPVSGQFRDQTVAAVLTQILDSIHLRWLAAGGQVLIVPKEDAGKMPAVVFDVSDFADKTADLTPAVIAGRIQKIVCPDEKVAVLDNTVSVRQAKNPQRTFAEIQKFLEQLRVLRHLPQKTALTGERLTPEVFGWDEVMKPLSLNYYQPVPLSQIVRRLEDRTKLTLLIDHRAFHQASLPFPSVRASVQCDQGTLNSVLELTLQSVEAVSLTYRIIDAKTLEITSAESASQKDKMTMEVHLCRLRAGETLEDIALSLRTAIEPESWVRSDDSETLGGGEIVADTPSHCLLIRQSQPAQRQIRHRLDAKKEESKGE